MTQRDYDVKEPLTHDGTRYEPGAVVPGLTDKQAAPLLAAKPPVIAPRAGDASQSTEPDDPGERHQLLVRFMGELEVPDDPKGSEQWTNGGKPDVYALAEALGWDSVSAKERDAAWKAVMDATASGSGS